MKHKTNALFFTFFKKGKHWEKRLFRHYFVACFGYVFLASRLLNQFVYDCEKKHEKTAQVWKILNWRSFLPKKRATVTLNSYQLDMLHTYLYTYLYTTVNSDYSFKLTPIYIHGIFVAQAIFPVSTNSWGSRTSNSCTLLAINIALSSVILISVQCSRGVVDVFLFAHCTLTAGLVIPITSRKTRLDEVVQAFFGRQLRVVAPINLANTNIAMKERYKTAALFLRRKFFNITL